MGFLSLFTTAATGGIPWKWIIIGIACLAVIAGAGFTVHAYNSAISNARETKALLAASQESLAQEHSNYLASQKQAEDLNAYYTDREKRVAVAAGKRQAILSERSTRDAQGDIDPSRDSLLGRLNGLFVDYTTASGGANRKNIPVASGLPGRDPAGGVSGMPGQVLSH